MATNSAFTHSSLNNPKYGPDIVVALTERDVNATMVQYLNKMRDSADFTNLVYVASKVKNQKPV
jgi:hypothetical protein